MKRLIVLVVAMLIPSGAFAKGQCDADFEKFCKNLKGEEAHACFDQHKSELSSACQASLKAQAACSDDIGKFCKDGKRKQLVSCLGEHKSELSPACQTNYESLSVKSD